MSEYIVEMKNITKRFPGIIANDHISIQIKKGEIFALLGENGAGKSTLMSMLFGMYEPDEGEIFVRGKKEMITSPSYATKLNIGMVHQHFKLISNYTIAENIILGMKKESKWLGILPYVDLKKANKEILALSKKYGLEVNPTDVVEKVNVSIQQRVEILKTLYREAEILIFDEPTAVLTPQEIEFLLKILKSLQDDGKTIILITHKLEEIKKVADRCAILNHGKLIDILDVKNTSTQAMANLMVGREVSFQIKKNKAHFGKNILSVKDLELKNEENFQVVNKVSFSIREGEIFALAGVSGNGQIEIADAIAGMRKISGGSIYLNGTDLSRLSVRKRTECGISYIPEDRQNVGLVMDLNLQDNMILKTYYRKPFSQKGILQTNSIRENGNRMIEKYDIRSSMGNDSLVRSMSGGNQQKAIIGREIELNSKLLIFVQPTRGLDIGAIENIHRQIIQERDAGKAILLVSLELDEIMQLADTIAVIYNGCIQTIQDAQTLTVNEIGEFMMGVSKNEK